jgi:hypothetical protein
VERAALADRTQAVPIAQVLVVVAIELGRMRDTQPVAAGVVLHLQDVLDIDAAAAAAV